MRILFHVEALVMHGRPFHYWAWLGRAAAMARALEGRGHTFRFLVNEALAERATAPAGSARADDPARGHGLPAEWVVALRQDELRRHFDAPNIAILDGFQHGRWPAEKVAACGQAVRERLAGFVPEIVLTYTPAAHLKSAFPGALVLHTENGMFSRAPFPPTQYFDPLGLYERSALGTHARELLARRPTTEERVWLESLRADHRAWLLAASPFHGLEQTLRRRHARLALLPLQFGGEAGFDLNGPFRNQGEYLLHVLERLPAGVGLVVTEHATAHWLGEGIDAETRAWVRARWPQVAWVDPAVAAHGSQMLLLHVDDVIGLSSSLGLQAMFWQKPLYVVGTSHLRPYAAAAGVEHIDPARPRGDVADRDGAIAWMMRHYFVPESLCLHDAGWIERFLAGARERHTAGHLGLDFFEPVADDATLARLHAPPAAPPPRVEVAPDLLRDGGFEDWGGPKGGEAPTHWALLAGDGAAARATRGDAASGPRLNGSPPRRFVRIERARGAERPTLLLQRVPDLDALAGAFVTLEFWARGAPGTTLWTYFYQQFRAPDAPRQGTPAQGFALDDEWRRFAYTVAVPEAPAEPRGPGHHTEVVFALPASADEARVELAAVALGPGVVEG